MRQRWFSVRALRLHLAVLVWTPGSLVAGWWQVTRALGGNALSYLYSVEWPVLAIVGVWAWWVLVHTDPATVGRRAQEQMAAAGGGSAGTGAAAVAGAGARAGGEDGGMPARRPDEEDAALAAYNDRLAELVTRGPQGWRRR